MDIRLQYRRSGVRPGLVVGSDEDRRRGEAARGSAGRYRIIRDGYIACDVARRRRPTGRIIATGFDIDSTVVLPRRKQPYIGWKIL